MTKIASKIKKTTPDQSFADRVRAVVRAIPKGMTRTYAEVARLAGSPHAARAVGSVMRGNYDPSVPCHRVVRSDGAIGDYNRGGPAAKAMLLIQERGEAESERADAARKTMTTKTKKRIPTR